MKKLIIPVVAIALLASCNSAPKETAETTEAKPAAEVTGVAYNVDTATSLVSFVGTKPVGKHTGDFKLTAGTLSVTEGNVSGGSFTIDVNSVVLTDINPYAAKLREHLLGADFFDVQKFPTATFEITGSEPLTNDTTGTHKISGNLTLKGVTENISFPAKISLSESEVTANASFGIDRTKWGIVYNNDKSLGDKFIYPVVEIALNIKAKK